MAFRTILLRDTYRPGLHRFGPVSIAQGVFQMALRFARHEQNVGGEVITATRWRDLRDALNNEQFVLQAATEISFNDGDNWSPLLIDEGSLGGVIIDPPGREDEGGEREWERFSNTIPQEESTTRKLRGSIQVFSVDIETLVQIEFLSR
jgi:hypothetical protein